MQSQNAGCVRSRSGSNATRARSGSNVTRARSGSGSIVILANRTRRRSTIRDTLKLRKSAAAPPGITVRKRPMGAENVSPNKVISFKIVFRYYIVSTLVLFGQQIVRDERYFYKLTN